MEIELERKKSYMTRKFIVHCGRFDREDREKWYYDDSIHPDELISIVENLVKYFYSFVEHEFEVATNSEIFFLALRVAVKEKRISHQEVEFHFHQNGFVKVLTGNVDARFEDWPDGFFDASEKLLDKLLG